MKFINADDLNIIYSNPYELMSILAYDYCQCDPVNNIDYNGFVSTKNSIQKYRERLIESVNKRLNIIHYVLCRLASTRISKTDAISYKNYIYSVASMVLSLFKCPISDAMFFHDLYGNGKSLNSHDTNLIKKAIIKSNTFLEKVREQIKNSKNGMTFYYEKQKNDTFEFSFRNDTDLFFSIQHPAWYWISGTKNPNTNIWKITFYIGDVYDFTDFSRMLKKGFNLQNIANDFGVTLQRLKLLTPYLVSIKYTFSFYK